MEKFPEEKPTVEVKSKSNGRKQLVLTLSESTNPATKVQRCYTKRIKADTKVNSVDEKCDNQSSVEEERIGECLATNLNKQLSVKGEVDDAELVIELDCVGQPEGVAATSAIEKRDEKQENWMINDIPKPVNIPVVTSNRRRLIVSTSVSTTISSSNSKKRNFFCDVGDCRSSFLHRATYIRHMRIHEISNIRCKICFKTFTKSVELLEHQVQAHNGQSCRMYSCIGHCDRSFLSEVTRNKHMERVMKDGKRYICVVCMKVFHNTVDLKLHTKSVHPENRQFSCKECGKEFKRETHVVNHMKQHFPTDNYTCNICNRDLKTLDRLKRHSLVHSANTFKCVVCSAGFAYNRSLITHLKDQHSKFFESMSQKQNKRGGRVYEYILGGN